MRVGRANGDSWLRLQDAADELGVSLNTLRRWSDAGKLTCYRSPGGHRRYRRRDIEAHLSGHVHPVEPVTAIASSPRSAARATAFSDFVRSSLEQLARACTEGLDVSSCALAAFDDRGHLSLVAEYSSDGTPHYSTGDALTAEDAPLAAYVATSGHRWVAADLRATGATPPFDITAYLARGARAILALPLTSGHRVLGVIEVVERRAARAFSGPNLAFVDFVARQAVTLLAEQSAPNLPGGGGTAPDPGPTLRLLAERATLALDATGCDILTLDQDRGELSLAASYGRAGASLRGRSFRLEEMSEVETVIASGRTTAFADLDRSGRNALHAIRAELDGAVGCLCAPLALGEHVRGVLEIFVDGPDRTYSPEEIEIAESIGHLAAIAARNADISDRLAAQSVDLAALSAMATTLAESAAAEALLRSSVRLLTTQTGAGSCILSRIEEDRRTVLVDSSAGGDPACEGVAADLAAFPPALEAAGEQVVVALSGPDDSRVPATARESLAQRHGDGAVVLVPLLFGDRTVGLVELGGLTADAAASAAEKSRVTASLIATAIAGFDTVAHLRRRTRDLEIIVAAGLEDTSHLNTDEVLHAVVQRLAELTNSPVADIYAVENDMLRALVSYDAGRFDADWEGVVVPLGRYPCSIKAVESGQIVVAASLDDPVLTAEGRFSLEKWGYQSQASIPLIAGGRVVGLAELSDYVPRDFAEDLELIRGLGQVAAHALENATLFEQIERRSRVLREMASLGTEVAQATDLDAVLRTVAERLMTVVDAADCDIYRLANAALRCVASYDRSGFDARPIGKIFDMDAYPATASAVFSRELLIVSDFDDPRLSPREREVYREFGFASEVCIPLVVNDVLYGLVDLYDTRPRDYAEYVDFLRSIGQLLAGSFQNALLVEQLEHRGKVLNELVDLGALLSQTRDLDLVLRTAAQKLRATIEVADCDIFTLQGDQLRCRVSLDANGFDQEAVGRLVAVERFPLTARALAERQMLVVADFADAELDEQERQDYELYGFQSELCIPLVVGDHVIGVIDIFDTRPRDYAEYLDFLKSVGQMIAGALENALLVDELERHNVALRDLVDLGAVVSSSGRLDVLNRAVAERLVGITGAMGVQIFAVTADTLRVLLTLHEGEFSDLSGDRVLELAAFPATIDVIATQKARVIGDVDDARLNEAERQNFVANGVCSELTLPLVADGAVVGLIEVYDSQPRDYAESIDLVSGVAQLVAGAFANAQLLERLERTNQELALLVESGLEFGSTLELDALLDTIARRALEIAGAACADIYAVEGDSIHLLVSVDPETPAPIAVGAVYPLDQLAIASLAVTTRQPVTCVDALTDPRLTAFERERWKHWGYRSNVRMPLIHRDKVIGLLSLFDRRPREFERTEVLLGLSQIAANAMANASLYSELDQSAERMTLVNELSMEFSSSLDLRKVLETAARRLCETTDVKSCDMYQLIGDDRLVCVAALADGEIDASWTDREFSLASIGSIAAAVESRAAVAIQTIADPRITPDELEYMAEYGEKSELAIPLIAKGRVIGAVELVETRAERVFTAEEITTAEAICRVAALAIDNADLFEDLQLRNREAELLNEIARATTASLDLQEVTAATINRLHDLVTFDGALLALGVESEMIEVAYATSPFAAIPGTTITSIAGPGIKEKLREQHIFSLDVATQLPLDIAPRPDESVRSLLLIALRSGDAVPGVLILSGTETDAFAHVDRDLLERVATHLSLAINNASLYEDIKRMHLGNLKTLSQALNAKDYYTLGHAARVAAYIVLLGRELGWEQDVLKGVEESAYLHDIGKIGVSDRVLLKPAGLNSQEWELMRQHPIFSADIIRPLFSEELVLGVRHHHEHFDGAGYPDGLAGEQIPLIARAMCVVDSYDAMSFRRPYRQGRSYLECLDELDRCRGAQFDPVMVDAFKRVLDNLKTLKNQAVLVAEQAAARIDFKKHALIKTPADESRPEYQEIAQALREVRDANPPTRFVSTQRRSEKRFIVVVDAETEDTYHSPIGEEVASDEDLAAVWGGNAPETNMLYVDQWGVWLSGSVPVKNSKGQVVATVSADLPASPNDPYLEGLRSDVTQTFASMLHSATARLGRAELDAITDGLTGLYNHRYLHERLGEEIERANEQGGTLALLFCDLDRFKAFNDRHHHSAGDRALRNVARIIEDSLRHVDLAARYGGEEFAAILIDTDLQGALEVAERIRAKIAAERFAPENGELTISIGVAVAPADAGSKEELIDKADWAMYLAKRRGRNRVMAFSSTEGADSVAEKPSAHQDYLIASTELGDAREHFSRRASETLTRLAGAMASLVDLDEAGVRAAVELATHGGHTVTEGRRSAAIVATAKAYRDVMLARLERGESSDAAAFDEFITTAGADHDPVIVAALRKVVTGEE
jgi:diguanylate cyclase (GGDEF)-like protein/excisionase family DNA binding protein